MNGGCFEGDVGAPPAVRTPYRQEILPIRRYTLLEQPAQEELLPACQRAGTAVILGGVFDSGLLAHDRPRPGLTYDYSAARPELVERAAAMAEVCERHGTTLPAAAIAFAAGHPAVSTVLLGAESADQVARDAAHFASRPSASVWPALVEAGLIARVPA